MAFGAFVSHVLRQRQPIITFRPHPAAAYTTAHLVVVVLACTEATRCLGVGDAVVKQFWQFVHGDKRVDRRYGLVPLHQRQQVIVIDVVNRDALGPEAGTTTGVRHVSALTVASTTVLPQQYTHT